MIFKRPIYRLLFFAGWLLLLGGLITLLIAANRKNKEHLCKGVSISINAGGAAIFVAKAELLKSMQHAANSTIVNLPCGDINLANLERTLESGAWIRDAELYFDTNDVLHVAVMERAPVARVFSTTGASFYMDSAGYQLPLLPAFSARLPVVTGFTASKKWSAADSALVQDVKKVVQAVTADDFWKAQIGQIDIMPDRKFELLPTIGDAVIRLGDAVNVADKLKRLLLFYRQVVPKIGFTRYSALDLQFDGQVIGVKKGPPSVIDSIQLQKNIQELIRKKALEQEAEGIEPEQNMQMPAPAVINEDLIGDIPPEDIPAPVPEKKHSNPPPKKDTLQKSRVVKTAPQKPKQQVKPAQKPKAVMQSGNEY